LKRPCGVGGIERPHYLQPLPQAEVRRRLGAARRRTHAKHLHTNHTVERQRRQSEPCCWERCGGGVEPGGSYLSEPRTGATRAAGAPFEESRPAFADQEHGGRLLGRLFSGARRPELAAPRRVEAMLRREASHGTVKQRGQREGRANRRRARLREGPGARGHMVQNDAPNVVR
jgi:hypothetical protein